MTDAEKDNSDLRLMELTARNPSLGGRELMMEIIERGPTPEEVERPKPQDLRAALKPSNLDAQDYRTRIEHADWLGKESPMMRDLYEHGAEIKGDTLIIPAEEYELHDDRDTPFITTLSYAQERIDDIERAREFHSLALAISGETADAKLRIAVFKNYFDRIARDERGKWFGKDQEAERSDGVKRMLEEMRVVASEMAKLETRESIEAAEPERIGAVDAASDRGDEILGSGMNVSARTVNLRDESLRFPAGLNYETKERLVRLTMPEIDRRLENGVSREALFSAIDNRMFRRDSQYLTERELKERGRIAGFLKGYVDERMRDPETRALNTSTVFREARAEILGATTPEALGRVASSILRLNERRSEELRLHRADPARHPEPAVMPLNARERNLLFNGRAPDHHTREMRDLRMNYGLSREERTRRAADLREGRIEPSEALGRMLRELETRRTAKAVAHFQAGVLNEKMNNAGRVNLYRLHQQVPPHERAYLFELCQERKKDLQRPSQNHRAEIINPGEKSDRLFAERGFGKAPRESHSFREYMSNMGRIERQLLNETVNRLIPQLDRERIDLTITEARSLLPEKTRDQIRLRAANLAWQSLVPEEVFERDPTPEAMRISETIAHMQEHLQDRARIAQAARNDFVQDKNGHSLSPADTRRLAELEKFAAKTRDDVYRGFETIDALHRGLELKRGSNQTHELTADSPNGFSHLQNGDLTKAGQLKSDQEWQFDSLREVLAVEMSKSQIETRNRETWEHQR